YRSDRGLLSAVRSLSAEKRTCGDHRILSESDPNRTCGIDTLAASGNLPTILNQFNQTTAKANRYFRGSDDYLSRKPGDCVSNVNMVATRFADVNVFLEDGLHVAKNLEEIVTINRRIVVTILG